MHELEAIHIRLGVLSERESSVSRLPQRVPLRILTNSAVPPNDGGISLGQAALAAFLPEEFPHA